MRIISKNQTFMAVLNSLKLEINGLHDWKLLDSTFTGRLPEIIFTFLIGDVEIVCRLRGNPLNSLLDCNHTDASIIVIGSIQPTNIVAWLRHHYIEKLREERKKSSNKFTDDYKTYSGNTGSSRQWRSAFNGMKDQDFNEAFEEFFENEGFKFKDGKPKEEDFNGEDFFRTFHNQRKREEAHNAGPEFEDFINEQKRKHEENQRKSRQQQNGWGNKSNNNDTSFARRGGMDKTTAYKILDIKGFSATADEIKKAYRIKAREWHPDNNQHRAEASVVEMQKINAAYQYLTK